MQLKGLIAGITALGLFGFAAHASANMPIRNWEVGPINAPSSSGVGYCSMKNLYQDGHGLVIARDGEGANSLAISFQQKTLQVGAQYTVGVRAENVVRQMVGLAATPIVLIVQMGLDRDFYVALSKKSSLQVMLKQQEINFSLDGTQEALEALTQCATALGQGKPFKAVSVGFKSPLQSGTVVVPPGQPVEPFAPGKQAANAALSSEIERLRIENQRLLAENQAATAKMMAAEKGTVTDPILQMEMDEQQQILKAQADEAQRNGQIKAIEAAQLAAAKAAVQVKKDPAPVRQMVEVLPKITAKPDTFLQDLLRKADLPAKAADGAFEWEVKELFGSAEEKPLPAGGGLRQAVDDYLAQAKSRCAGDFAHNEGAPVRTTTGIEFLEGEIACIDGRDDAAAALVFVAREGKFAIITHEGSTDQMEDALSGRMAVITGLSK